MQWGSNCFFKASYFPFAVRLRCNICWCTCRSLVTVDWQPSPSLMSLTDLRSCAQKKRVKSRVYFHKEMDPVSNISGYLFADSLDTVCGMGDDTWDMFVLCFLTRQANEQYLLLRTSTISYNTSAKHPRLATYSSAYTNLRPALSIFRPSGTWPRKFLFIYTVSLFPTFGQLVADFQILFYALLLVINQQTFQSQIKNNSTRSQIRNF